MLFGAIERQEEQDEALGRFDLLAHVPIRVIEEMHDERIATSAEFAGEGFEGSLADFDDDGVEGISDDGARARLDEAIEVAPLIAMADACHRAGSWAPKLCV